MKKLEDDPTLDALIKACASSKRGGKKDSFPTDYQVTFSSSLTKLFNYSPSFDGKATFECSFPQKNLTKVLLDTRFDTRACDA